jgi:hypothetical protein
MDFINELMLMVYRSNKLVANSTIQASFSVSPFTSSLVSGESIPPCWQMKQIITISKLVVPEEGTSNSAVQQAPPINYYESDLMKSTITTLKKLMDVSMHLIVNFFVIVYTTRILFLTNI